MRVSGTVMGPSNVKAVLIATWGTDISNMTLKEIEETGERCAENWKNANIRVDKETTHPFTMGSTHPVDDEERNQHLQVLLIGIDENYNAVGYYIVSKSDIEVNFGDL